MGVRALSNAARTGFKAAYSIFVVTGTMAALLTLAGLGPVQRWVVPWVLVTITYGLVAAFRARERSAPVTPVPTYH